MVQYRLCWGVGGEEEGEEVISGSTHWAMASSGDNGGDVDIGYLLIIPLVALSFFGSTTPHKYLSASLPWDPKVIPLVRATLRQ